MQQKVNFSLTNDLPLIRAVSHYCSLPFPFVVSPHITIHPQNITTVDYGESVLFHCTATGTPLPNVTWAVNGTTLINDSQITIYSENIMEGGIRFIISTLEICDVEYSDSLYSCDTQNTAGNDSVNFQLSIRVQGKLVVLLIMN